MKLLRREDLLFSAKKTDAFKATSMLTVLFAGVLSSQNSLHVKSLINTSNLMPATADPDAE